MVWQTKPEGACSSPHTCTHTFTRLGAISIEVGIFPILVIISRSRWWTSTSDTHSLVGSQSVMILVWEGSQDAIVLLTSSSTSCQLMRESSQREWNLTAMGGDAFSSKMVILAQLTPGRMPCTFFSWPVVISFVTYIFLTKMEGRHICFHYYSFNSGA